MLRKTISSKIKVLSLLMLFALFLAMPSVSHAKTSLTPAEIQAGFSRIALQYEAGEVLSETDAEFVRTYAKSTLQEMTPFKSQNVYGTKTFSNTTAALSGTISHVDSGVLTYTYGGNLLGQITAGNTPRNMKLTAYVEPFGVIDSSGTIAALARHSVSQSNSNNKVIRMSKTDTYNGACLFYNMYARLDITTSGGQGFNILCS